MFVFHVSHFFMSVLSATLLYVRYKSFWGSAILVLVETLIAWSIKAYDGELFGAALISSPSKADYVLGPFFKFAYVLMSYMWWNQASKFPCEFGPHVFTGFVVWRYIANLATISFVLPAAVSTDNSP